MWSSLFTLLVKMDRFLNWCLGGSIKETLSSRAHRLHVAKKPFGFMRNVINGIFFWQDDHCKQSYKYELNLFSEGKNNG